MTKIKKLTKEQEKELDEYREKWRTIGTSTDDLVRDTLESIISEFYRRSGYNPPQFFYFDSPLACQINASFSDQLSGRFKYKLSDQVRDQLFDQLADQFNDQLSGEFKSSIWGQLKNQLWGQFKSQFRGHLIEKNCYYKPMAYAQIYSYWIADYSSVEKFGVEYKKEAAELLSLWRDLARAGHIWMPFKTVCLISKRPDKLEFNEDKELHNTSGPAIKYSDGWSVYALNGIRVPAWIVEQDSGDIEPKQVLELENVDQRRAALRKIGIERWVQKAGADVLDKRDDYELLEIKLPGMDETAKLLKMKNPSIGTWHVEGVHDSCKTVQDALNFRHYGSEYKNKPDWKPEVLT